MVVGMQKTAATALIMLVGAAVVIAWLAMHRSTVPDVVGEMGESLAVPTQEPGVARFFPPAPVEPTPHPVSLPALMVKEFDGRDLRVGRILADNQFYTRHYITYASGDLIISGIMNVPKGDGPFPVLVLNHGFIDPAVYINGRGLRREQDYLARQGYVVIHPDYRNHADSDFDPVAEEGLRLGYTEDAINAIKAVQRSDLPYVDPERIGILGHSMGGGIALNIIVSQPDLVDAVVLFAPVSSDYRDSFNKWVRRRAEVAERIIAAYGSPQDNPEFWDNVSPATFFDKVQVPVLIHQGTIDSDVPVEWSEHTAAFLEQAGVDVTLHLYPGEPHEFARAWPMVMERTTDFFNTYVRS
jgi:uncharacterized protein